MRPLAIRTKLTLYYTGALTLLLVCLGLLAYQVSTQRLIKHSDETLDQLAAGLRGYVSFSDGKPALIYDLNDREQVYFISVSTQFLQMYDIGAGTLVWQSEASRVLKLAITAEQVRAVQERLAADVELQRLGTSPAEIDEVEIEKFVRPSMFDDVGGQDARFRFHSMVIRDPAGHEFLIRVGKSMSRDDADLQEIRNTFFMLTPLGILLSALGGWWMARRALKPVDDLAAAAQSISISQLYRRLPSHGAGDELDRLAATFNTVFAKLERAVDEMKQFTASMAHELRTPLTALQAEAEFALLHKNSVEEYRQVLVSQMGEYSRLSEMFNQLLLLARAESGEVQLARERVDLAELTRSLVEQMKPVAQYSNLSLEIERENSVEIIGDSSWLKNIVLNLLDNAIKFTPPEGEIRIAVFAVRPNRAAIAIRDTGIGIPEEALPHLFDRFFRVDSSRSMDVPGTGLGLTIVKWAVEAQGGTIEVDSKLGKGSCFTVLLPRSPVGGVDGLETALSGPAKSEALQH